MNLNHRSYQKELLDDENIPFKDIQKNMDELDVINTWLSGHSITINAINHFLKLGNIQSICEIGCGNGNNLAAIHKHYHKKISFLQFTGIDLKKECIQAAEKNFQLSDNTKWIVSDYAKVNFHSKPDLIFSSLFCHHFSEDDLVKQLIWMKENSNVGFFINDLHRHPIAYHFIKILTAALSNSYLVKNDAPISVARGFTKKEWLFLFKMAGLLNFSIQWKWAFRYLILYHNNGKKTI